MKQIPRLFTALCIATLATVTSFAAPNPKWVPAQSDFVITIDGINVADPTADQVWKDAYAKIGIPQQSPLEAIKLLEEECPGITEVFKAVFGFNDDFSVTDSKSMTFACTLQKEAGRFVRDLLPDHCLKAMYLFFPDPWPKHRHSITGTLPEFTAQPPADFTPYLA